MKPLKRRLLLALALALLAGVLLARQGRTFWLDRSRGNCVWCFLGGQASPPATASASAPATTASAATTAAGERRVHVFVSGRVQGVGFRDFTRQQAQALKLTGWVTNLRDGRVEAVIQGAPEKVAQLLEQIGKGPPSARVDKVEVADEKPAGEFKTFDVRR